MVENREELMVGVVKNNGFRSTKAVVKRQESREAEDRRARSARAGILLLITNELHRGSVTYGTVKTPYYDMVFCSRAYRYKRGIIIFHTCTVIANKSSCTFLIRKFAFTAC